MTAYKKTYAEKLKDPRWQKCRLKILERDNFTCKHCLDTELTLHVHHLAYTKNTEPWEYPDENFITLCSVCHDIWHMRKTELEKMLISVSQTAQQYLKLDITYLRRLRDCIYEQLKNNQ